MKELRDKANFFQTSSLVPTLDADATVIKSDTVIPPALRDSFREAFDRLSRDSSDVLQNGTERTLVDPSLFPLVYGRTRVFGEEVVGVADAVDRWAGKGAVVPRPQPLDPEDRRYYEIEASYWSEEYQWLPANIKFAEDRGASFTSYINNLHPVKYRDIYGVLEKLVDAALPAWEFCVSAHGQYDGKRGPGRDKARFPLPKNAE
ncbi:DUF4246 family protein [Candidatus Bathyarchaeota archaeon]|nr:DUF4246 family protein [Candidatus Bathyarchaeota archaeon]